MSQVKKPGVPAEWIHEIPTQASARKARIVSVAAILLAGLGVAVEAFCPPALDAWLESNLAVRVLLGLSGHSLALLVECRLMGVLGLICAGAGLLSLIRIRLTYRILRGSLLVVYPLLLIYVLTTWSALFLVLDEGIELGGTPQDRATILLRWWQVSWPALAIIAYVAWLHLLLGSRSVYAAFTKEAGASLDGDRVLEDIRTHGREPRARRSMYASVCTHLLILVMIPWLMQLGGCVEAYKVPKGSGNPVVAMVKMVKPKKKKKKSMTLRPNSAILFEVPDIFEETEVDQKMEEQTQVQYQAMANAKAGKMGKGGGTKGGWPEGMADYKVRFIRLDHGGAGWDDGMNDSGADINFLHGFAQSTGFKKIASKGESHSIGLLRKYPKDGFPPFVYLTGNGNMGRVSSTDQKILREYCLNGGMLIGDAGSAGFHRSFTHFIKQVFPDKPLLDIADDDMLYQLPYGFPNGAPAFWHHGGRRALGMKHEGRWMVFYHPGDMNDAWKSPGYNDVTPEMRDAAMQLGINLVYYAFDQWDDAVAKKRK
ncbi:MAG: hypothetical protein ACI9QL_004291 [Candidatus Omnitrophota bacterium]|jgi:hypothetical protein